MKESLKTFFISKAKLSILAMTLIFGFGSNIKSTPNTPSVHNNKLSSWKKLFQLFIEDTELDMNNYRHKEIKLLNDFLNCLRIVDSNEATIESVASNVLGIGDHPCDLANATKILFFEDLNKYLETDEERVKTSICYDFLKHIEERKNSLFKSNFFPSLDKFKEMIEASTKDFVALFQGVKNNFDECEQKN